MDHTTSPAVHAGPAVGRRARLRVASLAVTLGLTLGGIAIAEPVTAEPAASVVTASDTAQVAQIPGSSIACPILDRLAARFAGFPFAIQIIDRLRARFGCLSPG